MSREHSPLWQSRLSLGMKILYCSGVWSYIVGALTTPLFILIPLLTVWAGVFPIVVSWWAALALTAYMLAQTLVLNYTRKRKHIEPLWFAQIANNIMWWTYVKACWRSLYSIFGAPLALPLLSPASQPPISPTLALVTSDNASSASPSLIDVIV